MQLNLLHSDYLVVRVLFISNTADTDTLFFAKNTNLSAQYKTKQLMRADLSFLVSQ